MAHLLAVGRAGSPSRQNADLAASADLEPNPGPPPCSSSSASPPSGEAAPSGSLNSNSSSNSSSSSSSDHAAAALSRPRWPSWLARARNASAAPPPPVPSPSRSASSQKSAADDDSSNTLSSPSGLAGAGQLQPRDSPASTPPEHRRPRATVQPSHRASSPQPDAAASGRVEALDVPDGHYFLPPARFCLPDSASTDSDPGRPPGRSPTPPGAGPPSGPDDFFLPSRRQRKMHQTSSRLLRMTDDDRPFTRDFKDLFSTLVVSLPLTPHRVRFQKVEHTFTSDEAITNLGSLKFSQSNRMPDPKDPSRIVTTTTTTTFSMAREMARSVCQKFLEARFVESLEGKSDFSSKGAVWQLTPKGMAILARFCQKNGINQRHVVDALDSPRNVMHLVILEREPDTDKLHRDQATIEVIFRRFAGQDGPNIKNSTASSDSESLTEYASGLVGVKLARERKIGDRLYANTFTGKSAVDWLMDCCTSVDKRETVELATLFCDYGLMQPAEASGARFVGTKNSIYFITEKGQRVAGWIRSPKPASEAGDAPRPREVQSKDSNANRMMVIIRDPALRLLFREYLRETHCEENLAFYIDVREFLSGYNAAKRTTAGSKFEAIRETLAAAYSLYNAFLAPGSPCELNIDHSLRTALAARMTRAVGDDEAMVRSLEEVASLFDQAQVSVFKLMASDSVPKFMREPKYATILRERNLETALGGSFTIRT